MYFLIAAPPALLPRDQVPQDPPDPVRARQDGALRERGARGHQAGGEGGLPPLHPDGGADTGAEAGAGVPAAGVPGWVFRTLTVLSTMDGRTVAPSSLKKAQPFGQPLCL